MTDLKALIRNVPDFPRPGILYRDITTLLKEPNGFHAALDGMEGILRNWGPDKVAGIEARGFIFGAALADRLGLGFIPVRKKGKLPAATAGASYDLEYGRDELQIHRDAIEPGERVVIVDDLLATGGTVAAVASLLSGLGAEVIGVGVLLELTSLAGRDRLKGLRVSSLLEDGGV